MILNSNACLGWWLLVRGRGGFKVSNSDPLLVALSFWGSFDDDGDDADT